MASYLSLDINSQYCHCKSQFQPRCLDPDPVKSEIIQSDNYFSDYENLIVKNDNALTLIVVDLLTVWIRKGFVYIRINGIFKAGLWPSNCNQFSLFPMCYLQNKASGTSKLIFRSEIILAGLDQGSTKSSYFGSCKESNLEQLCFQFFFIWSSAAKTFRI